MDEFHHRVLLSFWVLRQLQDQLLTLLNGHFQLLYVGGHKGTLQAKKRVKIGYIVTKESQGSFIYTSRKNTIENIDEKKTSQHLKTK